MSNPDILLDKDLPKEINNSETLPISILRTVFVEVLETLLYRQYRPSP